MPETSTDNSRIRNWAEAQKRFLTSIVNFTYHREQAEREADANGLVVKRLSCRDDSTATFLALTGFPRCVVIDKVLDWDCTIPGSTAEDGSVDRPPKGVTLAASWLITAEGLVWGPDDICAEDGSLTVVGEAAPLQAYSELDIPKLEFVRNRCDDALATKAVCITRAGEDSSFVSGMNELFYGSRPIASLIPMANTAVV